MQKKVKSSDIDSQLMKDLIRSQQQNGSKRWQESDDI